MTQKDLPDMFRTYHPNTNACNFSLAPDESFFKMEHILSRKASLNRTKEKKKRKNPLYLLRPPWIKSGTSITTNTTKILQTPRN